LTAFWAVPGHPRRTWLNLDQEDANAISLSTLWKAEINRDDDDDDDESKKDGANGSTQKM